MPELQNTCPSIGGPQRGIVLFGTGLETLSSACPATGSSDAPSSRTRISVGRTPQPRATRSPDKRPTGSIPRVYDDLIDKQLTAHQRVQARPTTTAVTRHYQDAAAASH
jgi:hypothetical protein